MLVCHKTATPQFAPCELSNYKDSRNQFQNRTLLVLLIYARHIVLVINLFDLDLQ